MAPLQCLLLAFVWPLLVVTGVLGGGSIAYAEAGDNIEVARGHYDRGLKAYDLEHYPEAIAEFEAAYYAKPDPALLFNLAQAHRLNGDLRKAISFYKTYLRKLPQSTNRGEVEARIASLGAQLQEEQANATAVDRTRSSTSPPVPSAAPSSHAPSREDQLALNSGSRDAEGKPPIHKQWWFWTGLGAAVIGGTVAIWALNNGNEAPAGDYGPRKVSF